MSLGGSLVFIIYLLMKPIALRYFRAKWQYTFLKIVMLFYILPYQCFKFLYLDFIYAVLGRGGYSNPTLTGYIPVELEKMVILGGDGLPYFRNRILFLLLVSAWLFLVCFIVIKQVIRYFRCRRKLLMISENAAEQAKDIMEKCWQDISLGNKKQIKLLKNKNISSPFTIGIFPPCIIIPDMAMDNRRQKMLLTHELIHIKNHDILFKFLSFFLLLLHWFNPLVYFLFFELCNVSERVCDEKVTVRMKEKEKADYGMMVIEMAQKPSDVSILFADSFSRSKTTMKGRIEGMKKTPVASEYMKIAAAIIAVIILLVSPISVWAYEPMVISERFMEEDISNADMAYFILGDETEDPIMDDLYNAMYFEYGNEIFVDSDGNIYDISHQENPAPRAICFHSMASGQYYSHSPNGTGCTITIYNAEICTKCTYIKLKDMVSQTTYAKCTH